MKAWVMVADHPYFAVTDANGNFEINNVPDGTYEVMFWQEKNYLIYQKKYIRVNHAKTVNVSDNVAICDYTFPKLRKNQKNN